MPPHARVLQSEPEVRLFSVVFRCVCVPHRESVSQRRSLSLRPFNRAVFFPTIKWHFGGSRVLERDDDVVCGLGRDHWPISER